VFLIASSPIFMIHFCPSQNPQISIIWLTYELTFISSDISATPHVTTVLLWVGLAFVLQGVSVNCRVLGEEWKLYCVCNVLGLVTWSLNACCYSSTNNQICQTCTCHIHQIALLTRWDQPGSAQPEAGQLNSTDLQDQDLHPTASPVTHLKDSSYSHDNF